MPLNKPTIINIGDGFTIEEKLNQTEILRYALENNIIDLSYVQEKIEMVKREEILKEHRYSIWQGKDGKWYTYLPTDENGRKLCKRTTEKGINDLIVQHYRKSDKHRQQMEYRFDNCWKLWKEKQISYGISSNTVSKYNSDYKRYFEGMDFEKLDIRKITEEDITIFMISRIRELNLKEKAGKALWGYISGVFKSARINKKIMENPCSYVETRRFSKFYNREQKPLENRILSNQEIKLLEERLQKDHEEKPYYIQSYAVELAIYTGMRVGELAALRWSNISLNEDVIIISESERFDRIKKEYVISGTKTGKTRIFPMTGKIKEFFRNLKKAEMRQGILGEYVFSDETGRITARSISECMRRKCSQAGIDERGIHSLRRTLNSKMRCDGVSATVAASLLGHTEKVNQENYTYDITGMDYKRKVLQKVIEA